MRSFYFFILELISYFSRIYSDSFTSQPMFFFSTSHSTRGISLLLILFSIHFSAWSQTAAVKGTIKDAGTGETLPYCNVFVNNTTISTVTDMDGNYSLEGLEAGPVELGFSFMGYEAQTKSVTLNPGGTLTVNLSMKPLETELSDVEIKAKRDKSWERDLRKFENLFLGNDAIAAQSEILNPWVIDFPEAEEKGSFKAEAQLPIELVNNYLGYKITFDLKEFFDTPTNYRIAGAARFEELNPESDSQRSTWEQNRADTYRKSPQNMFRAMISGDHLKEGFYLYGDKAGGSPSMNMRSDIFANELGRSVVEYKPQDLVTPADKSGEYLINLKGRIEIHYQKGYTQVNTYKDAPYPVSWLEVNSGKVRVKANGSVLNPQDLVFSGDMDRKRISTLLPLDYDAEKAIQLQNLERTAQNLQEKVFLHTDKPFYYAGDEVFFKAFLNYGNPLLNQELSTVLYVELINANRDYIIEKKFKIFDGAVAGNFHLPDSLSQENYFLRAYTNWNRNYGPEHLYVQPLQVLDLYTRIQPTASSESSSLTSVYADQVSYEAREKVTLTISAKNQDQKALQTILSVSVLDQTQVPLISYPVSIDKQLTLDKISDKVDLNRFAYTIEKGITQKGKTVDEKGKGEEAEITIFVNDFEGMIDLQSDKSGEFILEDMEFYGPMKLAIQAMDKKGKPVASVELTESLKAPVVLPPNPSFPKTYKVETSIRPLALVPDDNPNEMEAEETSPDSQSKQSIYGSPDYVVTGEKLMGTGNTVDLVNSLAGNVPGMRVTVAGASGQQQIRFRGSGSFSGSLEPVVMINGSIRPSTGSTTAADNLRTVNPNDIDRVEIVTRTVSMLGDQGANGVIAVYLKEGSSPDNPLSNTQSMSVFTLEGYQPVQNFYQLDYDQEDDLEGKDLRQTLYWNPTLVTDESGEASISFFTNDSAGPMTVEIRGLSVDGKPVSGTFTINQK